MTQDKEALSVVTLITGETLRGSWWSHARGQEIFAVLSSLSEHPDVLFSKLLSGKVTLVHRKLWPAFLAVATEKAPWQLRGLSEAARRLLASVESSQSGVPSTGKAVKKLEVRLLVCARQVHSPSGRHETVVEPWSAWARQARVKPLRSPAIAKQQLEQAARDIGANVSALPWPAG